MIFANAFNLFLLLFIPLMILFFIWREHARSETVKRIGNPELIQMLMDRVSPRRRLWKKALWLLALATLVIAIARPVWGVEIEPIEVEGVQVVLVLDVSRSMDVQDINPSRLERAKLDMRDLITSLEGNDISIVLFAGEAMMYLPMTYDANTVESFVTSVTSGSIGIQGTALEDALRLAMEAFDFRTGAQPVIVVASDGENHVGDALAAAVDAAAENIIIHVLGYGTVEGSVIPVYDGAGNVIDFKTDEAGELIESRLDEPILNAIADVTGGTYQRVTSVGAEIVQLAEDINTLQQGTLGEAVTTRQVERFGLFVLLAVLALSLEIILPEARGEKLW